MEGRFTQSGFYREAGSRGGEASVPAQQLSWRVDWGRVVALPSAVARGVCWSFQSLPSLPALSRAEQVRAGWQYPREWESFYTRAGRAWIPSQKIPPLQ